MSCFDYLLKKIDYQENAFGLHSIDLSDHHENPNLTKEQKENNLFKVIEWYLSIEKPSEYVHSKVVGFFSVQGVFTGTFRGRIEKLAFDHDKDMVFLVKLCEVVGALGEKDGELLDFCISAANKITKLAGYSKDRLLSVFGADFIYNHGGRSKSGPGPYPQDLDRRVQLTGLIERENLEPDVREILSLALARVEKSIEREIKSDDEQW